MVPGILGKKIGMTQIFKEDGKKVPVTVIEAGPCEVQAVKTSEKDGYNSVQLGYDDTKEMRLKKPQRANIKTKNLKPKKFVRELRCEEAPDVAVGAEVTNKIIQVGDFLDIVGTSKGKGFQGVMKRHGFSGSLGSHGASSMGRRPGSVGQSSYPSRVFKGLSMGGHMGSERVTVQNVEVVDVNFDDNTIAVKGAVPGANGSYLVLSYAIKKELAERTYQEEEPEVEAAEEAAAETQEAQAEDKAEVKEEAKEAPAEEKKEQAAAPEAEENKEGNKE